MLCIFFYLKKKTSKTTSYIQVSILSFLLIMSIILPDNELFGGNEAVNFNNLSDADKVHLIVHGFTWWRALTDISILLFILFTILILVKKSDSISRRTNIVFSAGLGFILFAALYDHLVDFDRIHSVYILPFAIFMLYMILSFIPYIYLLKEVINKDLLIEQEKKWRNLLNEAEIIVVGLNRMGHVEFINPYFFELTGYQEDEVLGKDWFEFFIPPKDYYNLQGAFIEILEFEFHPHYFNPILTKNKAELMIMWFNVRTRDHNDTITGSLSIGVDVTKDFLEKNDLIKKLKDAEDLIVELKQKGSRS